MGKTWVGLGVRAVVEYTLSLFAALESLQGWFLGNPSEWLSPFAGWPLYSALTFFAACMFLLGSINLYHVGRQVQARKLRARRDALVEAVEETIGLYSADYMDSMERLSLLELNHSELERFDLAAPDGISDEHTAMYYRRLLPYLRLGVNQAQRAARSWKERHDG